MRGRIKSPSWRRQARTLMCTPTAWTSSATPSRGTGWTLRWPIWKTWVSHPPDTLSCNARREVPRSGRAQNEKIWHIFFIFSFCIKLYQIWSKKWSKSRFSWKKIFEKPHCRAKLGEKKSKSQKINLFILFWCFSIYFNIF